MATIALTVLAAVVVLLTRLRLSRTRGRVAGRLSIPSWLLNVHTVAGTCALVMWSAFLLTANAALAWLGLALWWVTVAAGLLILARWLPTRGRHSTGTVVDSWSEGPGLSVLAHVGLLVGVVAFTVLVALDAI